MRVLGLMSGTSIDAVDHALCDLQLRGDVLELDLLDHAETPWPDDLRALLLGMLPPASTDLAALTRADTLVGEHFGAVARALLDRCAASGPADLVVSHGQTLLHWVDADGRARGTLQIGSPAFIAEATCVPVLSDLRSADIAAGGQGAPLAATLDALWLGDRPTAALNLGGIANVTIVGCGPAVCGDTGPANCLLDAVAQRATGLACDVDGRLAASGSVDADLLAALLAHPFLARPLPRSTGRETFSLTWLDTVTGARDVAEADLAATLVEFTARTIADVVDRHPVQRTVVSGGGVRNPVLMARLRDLLPPVVSSDDLGLPSAAKEAVLMALLGWLSAYGLPGVLPASTDAADQSRITGARGPRVLGTLTAPHPSSWTPSGGRERASMPCRVAITQRARRHA